jgi:Ca2+/H+ antiporter, TMEM165/GDT1 family
MLPELYVPAIIAGFILTIVELTEVVALVFALSADHHTIAHGAAGAVSGIAVVGVVALAFGAFLIAFPKEYLLWASAIVLTGFAVFLFRSTLRSYRRSRANQTPPIQAQSPGRGSLQFAGGFSVGAVEATEVVVVLLALAAAGYGFSAIVGAVAAGVGLVVATAVVQQRIRRIKVPWLKLGANSMLFAFAVFWAGEALGIAWPGSDLFLIPLFVLGLVLVRGAVELGLRRAPQPAAAA